MGIIPKPHQPGRYHLIVDLSSPQNFSINDGIQSSLCSLVYTSVGQAAELVRECGKGALMVKHDLKCLQDGVSIHPADQHLLGLDWQGMTYCDCALPFDLRSAPKIFTAIADGVTWAMVCKGIQNVLHYLDDFFFCAPASSNSCKLQYHSALNYAYQWPPTKLRVHQRS